MGKRLWELYPQVVGSLLETNYRRAMEERVRVEFEYYYEPWERWYRHPRSRNRVRGSRSTSEDSTDNRKAEQVLRRSEQLAAAGRLAVSISHEINNPLEAVTNVLYPARMDDGLTGKARDLLTIADKELKRLSHIAARSLKLYRQRTSPIHTPLERFCSRCSSSTNHASRRTKSNSSVDIEQRPRFCACQGKYNRCLPI